MWADSTSGIDQTHNLINTIRTNEKLTDKTSVQTRLDAERGLVYAISQLEQNQPFSQIPRGVLRDWEEIIPKVPKTPIGDQMSAILGKIKGDRPLQPQQIEGLISLGQQSILSKASPAIAPLQSAQQRGLTLDQDEKALLDTNGASEFRGDRSNRIRQSVTPGAAGGASSAAAYPVKVSDIPGKGRIALFSDGTYRPAP
jgi:hypothetical protein